MLKVISVYHLVVAEASCPVLVHHNWLLCSDPLWDALTAIYHDTRVLRWRSMSIHVFETSLDSILSFLGLESCETRICAASLSHIYATLYSDHIISMLHILCESAFCLADVAGLWSDI